MRRQILILSLLVFLSSSGPLPAASPEGQPVSDFLSPKDTVSRYFDNILRPALDGKSPPDEIVRGFYASGLSDRTREQVSEDQFMEYWTYVASRMRGALKYSIGEPIESEGHDQALILVTGALDYAGLFGPLGFPSGTIVGCISDMHRASSDCTRSELGHSGGEFEATYWVVKEDNAWKLVLHNGLVREMQQRNPITVRRYTPNIAAAQAGLTIRVQEVDLRTESTTMRLLIENDNSVEAGLRNALSLASLTDDRGVTFNTRILRSTIPETAPAHSSAVAVLTFVADLTTFKAVPIDARQVSLSLPHVRVRDSDLTLHLDITLIRPLPHAAVVRASMPGEPVLVYLLTFFHPRFTTWETFRTLYQTLLSRETRSRVTEQEFVDYYRSGALDAWLCRLGVPDDFTIGVPTYSSPDQVSIPVTTARREPPSAPVKGAPGPLTFRVVKEADTWKLALQEDLVKEIKAHPPLMKRYHVQQERESNGVRVVVNEVVLEPDKYIVRVTIKNYTGHDISYDRTETTLTDSGGYPYQFRGWGPSGPMFVPEGGNIVLWPNLGFLGPLFDFHEDFTLEFDIIPIAASRDLSLTLGKFGNSKFSVNVRIYLDPTSFACP